MLLTFGYVQSESIDQSIPQGDADEHAVTDEFARLDVEDKDDSEEDTLSAPTNVEVNGSTLSFHAAQENHVAGYRVYRNGDDENDEHVESISNHERKSYTDPEASHYSYYVTTVDIHGQEFEPSEIVSETF